MGSHHPGLRLVVSLKNGVGQVTFRLAITLGVGFRVKLSDENIAEIKSLRDVAMATILEQKLPELVSDIIWFDNYNYIRVSIRRREMYCRHPRLCVCLSVRGRMPTLLHGTGCNLGSGRGCPLFVHYWADLQSGHGLRCYGNITRTRNVSEYMLVIALYRVCFGILNNCNIVFCTLYFAFYNLLFLFILHHFDAAGNTFDI